MDGDSKRYFCHNCNAEFRLGSTTDIKCTRCQSCFCEEVANDFPEESEYKEQEEEQPAFISTQSMTLGDLMQPAPSGPTQRVYRIEQNLGTTTLNGMLTNLQSLLSGVIGNQLAEQVAEQSMDNVIDQIMRNDPNKYGAPPASKKSLDSLERGCYEKLSKLVDCTDMKLVSMDGKKMKLEEAKLNAQSKDCSVCKDEFETQVNDLVRMPCMHIFHNDCIMPWLEKHNSCPTCRFELPTDDEDYEKRKKEKNGEIITQEPTPVIEQETHSSEEENNSPPAPAAISSHSFNIRHLR